MSRLVKKANITMYHATGFDNLDSILANGLIPRQDDQDGWTRVIVTNDESNIQKARNVIFLATTRQKAEYYMGSGNFNGYDPMVVLELSVNENNLLPDDVDCPEAKTWQETKNKVQQVKHNGPISPNQIVKIHFFHPDTEEFVLSSTPQNWKKDIEMNADKFEEIE